MQNRHPLLACPAHPLQGSPALYLLTTQMRRKNARCFPTRLSTSPGVTPSSLCRRETVAFDLFFCFFFLCFAVPGGFIFWVPRTSLHGCCLPGSQDACAVQQVTLGAGLPCCLSCAAMLCLRVEGLTETSQPGEAEELLFPFCFPRRNLLGSRRAKLCHWSSSPARKLPWLWGAAWKQPSSGWQGGRRSPGG